MTTQSWPAALPRCPALNGRRYEPESNVVGFQPDVGPALLYPRATAAGARAQFTWNLTREQLRIFDAWYRNDLKGGSQSFLMFDPFRDEPGEWQIEADTVPSYGHLTSHLYQVALSLYRLP